MVGADQIGYWVGRLADLHGRNYGEMSVEKAKNMLVYCACVESAVTGFLIKHHIQSYDPGPPNDPARHPGKGRKDA